MFWWGICFLKTESMYKDQLLNAFMEAIAVHCKNNMKPINTVCWQTVVPLTLQQAAQLVTAVL
jgi:hypothetical protein